MIQDEHDPQELLHALYPLAGGEANVAAAVRRAVRRDRAARAAWRSDGAHRLAQLHERARKSAAFARWIDIPERFAEALFHFVAADAQIPDDKALEETRQRRLGKGYLYRRDIEL